MVSHGGELPAQHCPGGWAPGTGGQDCTGGEEEEVPEEWIQLDLRYVDSAGRGGGLGPGTHQQVDKLELLVPDKEKDNKRDYRKR